jgi:hypothetical protein
VTQVSRPVLRLRPPSVLACAGLLWKVRCWDPCLLEALPCWWHHLCVTGFADGPTREQCSVRIRSQKGNGRAEQKPVTVGGTHSVSTGQVSAAAPP